MHGQVVCLSFLLDKLQWSLQRIDEEIQRGGIETIMRSGQLHYKLLRDFGQSEALKRQGSNGPNYNTNRVGAYVNRKALKW